MTSSLTLHHAVRTLRTRGLSALACVALLLLGILPAAADTHPSPAASSLNERLRAAAAAPTLPPTIRLPKLPTAILHTEYVVETNKKGQVTRVRSGKGSSNPRFNMMTYGNALQAFIRTETGRSVPGVFRLTYDYSPETKMVGRRVTLIRAGGVNANARGAVDTMKEAARKHASAKPKTTK